MLRRSQKLCRRLGGAAAAASLASVPALALLAAPAQAAIPCFVWAHNPAVNVHDIGERGGRTGCSNVTTVYGLLVDSRCLAGRHDYYIDTDANGAHATSEDRTSASCG